MGAWGQEVSVFCSAGRSASVQPEAQRQNGLVDDVLWECGFYFPSPNSHISLFPIHHSDSGLSYQQITKDPEAQCITGGT